MKGKFMSNFKVFVTEPIPEIEFGLKILKDAEIRIKNEFIGFIPAMDITDIDAIIAGDAKIKKEAIEEAKKQGYRKVWCRSG
jgi:hypothetical protein